MSKKMFWNGLGFGLIGGALLLQLMLGVQSPPSVGKETVSKESQPPVETPEISKKYTQAEFDQKLQARLKEEVDKIPKPEAPKAEIVKQTAVYITPGLNSDKVVEMFQQSGLINEPTALSTEIKKRGLTSSIRSGVHIFKGEPSVDVIIETIIRKP
ncbi:hypothetical protein [Paenibacillus sp. KN14-4R]|uniref:hypothetical protein n=1 Tax=Paenibacillus sp. KN14-4R TaxID=3445773 RepID=UPI003FA0DDE1